MEIAGVAAVLVAALIPLLRPLVRPPLEPLREGTGPAAQLRALETRKAAIYGAIREVGFDLRTDKMSQADYEDQVTKLKSEAVVVVGELETLRQSPPRGPAAVEAEIEAAMRAAASGVEARGGTHEFCTQCGASAREADRFCGKCGTPLSGDSPGPA